MAPEIVQCDLADDSDKWCDTAHGIPHVEN